MDKIKTVINIILDVTGQHNYIKISILPVGHTKCFELTKRKYHKMSIGCLDDTIKAVNESGSPNIAVPTFNWSGSFEDVTVKSALKGISCIFGSL